MLNISLLRSGGVITNYQCSSQCRHCLYACSPHRPKDYLEPSLAEKIFKKIKALGCHSVHIGGGEPFLHPDKLLRIADVARECRMAIEYIETNASWHQQEEHTLPLLRELIKRGVHTLLVSISPFHNEYIPFQRTKGLIAVCHKAGMHVFPWTMDFYYELQQLDDTITHSPEEYMKRFGKDYFQALPGKYWIHYGGRALDFFSSFFPLRSLEQILNSSSSCHELENTSHFHVDLYGNYLPGLCAGLAVHYTHLGQPLPAGNYPLLSLLYSRGTKGLYEWAHCEKGFVANKKYLNKCHLCTHIRHFLVSQKEHFPELVPEGFYSFLKNN